MTIDDKIKDEKLQFDINREAAKTYLRGEEILPADQSRIIEQAKFTYPPLVKAFKKTNKNTWRTRKKTSWSFRSFKTYYPNNKNK